MKNLITPAAILLIILCGAQFVPAANPYSSEIAAFSVAVALIVLFASLSSGRRTVATKPAAAEALQPAAAPPATSKNHAEAEVIAMLGLFQEKGRFVDFLMNDITPYDDAQVGSVVRAVHQGCKSALEEHFSIEPVAAENEGTEITVPAGYSADQFRLVGNISGEAPFKGRLVHKGWKVKSIKLPRVLNVDENRLPAIAPAQVELG